MSIDDIESSDYLSTPVRYFVFTMGNQVWRYVGNSSQPISLGVDVYRPDPVIGMGELSMSLGEAPPSVQVTISSSTPVAQLYLPYMPPDRMYLHVARQQEEGEPGTFIAEFIGEITSSSFDESNGTCTLTVKMSSAALSRPVPWPVVAPICTYALYGPGCLVDREAYKTVGSIVGGAKTIALQVDTFAAAGAGNAMPEKWFRNGFVRHVASGEVRTVLDHVGNTVYLQTPFGRAEDGDELEGFAGCSRQRNMCKARFNNYLRFAGFPWVPNDNPYTQNVFGTGAKTGSGTQIDLSQSKLFGDR